ncbi:hypothetical protein DOTSEDRAFT_21028 [Dothistroma septosporum NZE10]|uniref:RING-type domain-containing protein n=1 Tax=Dothistroma septosporum (strain NZE10 / CBS 128990) TaxID=675120 RepID=N1PXV5_DOTSN|nr:hypothetical protein DOTSEDRAFT_21028 [Dothistroma septosporum NZE10]
MSLHLLAMAPILAFGSLSYYEVQDSAPRAKRAELAPKCRKHNAQRREAAKVEAKQQKAAAREAEPHRRDSIIAGKMPQLCKEFEKASETRLHDHLSRLRRRDFLDGTARNMALTESSIFEYETCELCLDEMARPLQAPSHARHQLCERCVTKKLEESEGDGLKCPSCGEEGGGGSVVYSAEGEGCRREVREFYGKVSGVIREAERDVGIRSRWWRGVSQWEVVEAVVRFVCGSGAEVLA